MTSDHDDGRGVSRRRILECMTWAGTGVLWTLAGGVPQSIGIIGEATAAEPSGLTFLQISDSHVGFDKAANPNAIGTLEEAISRIQSMPIKPSFIIHTGDITHLSKPSEFDDADRIISQARLDVHYVPGEHDFLDEDVKLYRDRYGRGTKGNGWYSFDANGVHFIGLVNVVDLKAGGLGNLGNEQLAWLEDDLKGRSASTPIVVFAHIPLWTVYPAWGWGTEDAARALDHLKRFGSVTVLNGHIHQIMQKVEGSVTFHTAMSTAFPQPAPGAAPSPGPMRVADDAALAPRRYRRQLQARAKTARDYRPAAPGLRREIRIMTRLATNIRIAIALAAVVLATAAVVPVASAPSVDLQVQIDQFIFAPQRITVKTGTTVTWINDDDVPHTVVSNNKLFKSKTLDTKDSFSFTFMTPGTYDYFCSLHPHMTGTVVVEAATGSNALP